MVATIAAPAAASETYVEKGGAYWYNTENLKVRELARAMNAIGARFVTITAYQLPKEDGFRLEYHWDLAGRLLGFGFNLAGNTIESIYDLCEAVDWIEREIHEGFAIDFTGREYEPLQLHPGDTPGVNLRETGAPGKPASGLARVGEEVAK
jgi:NADH:ubiquinone oxidoreductase subunit C